MNVMIPEPGILIPTILFYAFSVMMVVSALMVISAKNPVHSVLFLIFAFFNSAGLFVLLGAEFIAMLMVIVYVGAVAVLFLFVVMMLNIDYVELRSGFMKHLPLGVGVAALMLVELVMVVRWSIQSNAVPAIPSTPMIASVPNTQALGRVLYTDYIYVFQLSGVILLVAMISAITLTHRVRSGVRKQNISKQVSRRRSEGVEIIHVQPGKGV